MYRKILFIAVNLIGGLGLQTKAVILLFLCLFSMLITFFATPFLTKELNYLEVFSNISALILLYSGCLYLNQDNDIFKSILYITIFFVNIAFTLFWASSILNLILDTYENALLKKFPSIYLMLRKMIGFIKRSSMNIKEYSEDLNVDTESKKTKTTLKPRKFELN
jgi:Na+/melibiose symporter-like transporter